MIGRISILLAGFVSLSSSSFAQFAVITEIKQKNPLTKEIYIFSKVVIEKAPEIAKKINNHLRSELLQVHAGTKESRIFKEVWATKEHYAYYSDITYRVVRNDNKILSLIITGEGCGTYCETYSRNFNFNIKTGNVLEPDSLFTEAAKMQIADNINLFRTGLIAEQLLVAEISLQSVEVLSDSSLNEYYTMMQELFKLCLETKIQSEDISALEFLMNDKSIIFYSERCSAHYNRIADEIGIFEYELDPVSIGKYLNAHGRSVFEK